MDHVYKRIRVFVASPGDVRAERDQLAKVVAEINLTIAAIAPERNALLELVRWETHVAPGLGRDAQEVVNRQIGDYDLFVGILWKRMGTPTSVASSGTEEEFRAAYDRWTKDASFPVLFYFCQQPFPPPRTLEDVEQLGRVVRFRDDLSAKGLVAEYPDHESFADAIRPHLLLVLGRMVVPQQTPAERASRLVHQQAQVDTLGVREQIAQLARDYEQLRRDMPAGDERTRRMDMVAAKVRTLAIVAHPLVPELVVSASPGMRMAATALLQSVPSADYLLWLAERLGAETPFVAYQAALALLEAVRSLHASHSEQLREAISRAKAEYRRAFTGAPLDTTDRYRLLEEAERELERLVNASGQRSTVLEGRTPIRQ
jgi:hypothetical protein